MRMDMFIGGYWLDCLGLGGCGGWHQSWNCGMVWEESVRCGAQGSGEVRRRPERDEKQYVYT